MDVREHESLKTKTTMRIGGTARYFTELKSQSDVEEALAFANEKKVPLVLLGSGANTVFADGEINALVARIAASEVKVDDQRVTVDAGKNLAMLINELAEQGLDLSSLTGIPGTMGGAIFGNAGQGPKGIWIDAFVISVTALVNGEWKTFSKKQCEFRYRESWFKDQTEPVIIWSVTLEVPKKDPAEIKVEVLRLLQKRIETQPHVKTAGSCFKATADGTPAWQLIDKAGLRGYKVGGVEVSEKHANFLLNVGGGTFADVVAVTEKIKEEVPEIASIEMRLINGDGSLSD
jgi:UDP-N-acetylmuramate dehydrogenase